ncbi:efflux transporter outer membrane subunit [Burkholderia dolosa]|uniref:Efflux transporter outer membrane subunit n=1 Tax=Burkholderia dolosa TaxID=152500 RepID=A0A892IBQ9_9BURK|nr:MULTISPECIES: efflux transporter outer membrane subunit [Burkholderia]AKE06929.1 RND transporter [Burkholderia cepacia]AJY09597.1 efflux transporter, outer membrane factor (OMF) lipo, NodT family protein [Burkholderia dolosa AU0158]AYZ95360.1 efflux transporter outer membrane subunit [Burkholderia dolosa]ETP62061.1 RND transporter [Burkholderia dolosa PC543]MBR8417185.1 efflux transporter outer membrane subunit [Burkholderia dolosa]
MKPFPLPRHAALTLGAAACLLAGCTVGPDYRGAPAAPDTPIFVRAPASGVDAGTPAPSAWWHALNDRQLDALIAAALAHNPDVHAAQARLREARAQLTQQRAAQLPKSSATVAAIRMREPDVSGLGSLLPSNSDQSSRTSPSAGASGPLQLYSAGFDATWEIDLFGGTRRAVEAASAQAEAVDADLADTQVSLAAEVATAYVDLRDRQQRLALSQRTAELQRRMLELTQQRRARGAAADADIERLTTQVENTRASLIPLDAQVTESLDRLAILTGRAPGALDAELSAPDAPLPTLPGSVPIGDPAALLKQRPDIRAAERRLASSNAQIGEHVADYFPKVTLLGDLGFSASDPGHLLRKQNFTWIGAPYLQWNILDFGRTRGAVRAAQASRDEAEANYRKAVLGALQDANTALQRYGHQREHVVALTKVRTSATHSAALMDQRYRAGVASMIDLLDTQREALAAQQNVIAGQAELIKDYVSLQKSLGLGWQSVG